MDKVNVYREIHGVEKQCNMEEFGRRHIPGYKSELGYGYFEFKEPECLKPHKNVIVVDKVQILQLNYTVGYYLINLAGRTVVYRS